MKTTAEERMEVAKTIWQQVRATLSVWEICSWGVSKKVATEYNGKPALQLRVSGLQHKGWAVVALDYGSDTYEVYLTNIRGEVKKQFEDVYADELGDLLDREIERGTASDGAYLKAAMADSNRKLNR